jgi:DNA polymerase family B
MQSALVPADRNGTKMDCMSSAFSSLDTMVYSTGVMTSCMVSSALVNKGLYFDWSKCTVKVPFKGGHVVDPIAGVHSNIIMSADFNSMHPNIMIGRNISAETVRWAPKESHQDDGKVYVRSDGIVECIIGEAGVPETRRKIGTLGYHIQLRDMEHVLYCVQLELQCPLGTQHEVLIQYQH